MVCYVPGTGTLAVIGLVIYLAWHKAIGHFLHAVGAVMETTLMAGTAVGAVTLVIWTARAIQRRRAVAGACTTCRFRCQQALQPRPNLLVNIVDRRQPAPAPVPRASLTCHPAAPILGRPRTPARHAAPAPALFRRAFVRRRTPALAPAALFERVVAAHRTPVRPAPLLPVLSAPVLSAPVLSAPLPAPPSHAVRGEPASAARPAPAVHHEPARPPARRRILPVPAPVFLVRPRATPTPPGTAAGPARPADPAGLDESVAVDGYVLTPDGVDLDAAPVQAPVPAQAPVPVQAPVPAQAPAPAQASASTRANAST